MKYGACLSMLDYSTPLIKEISHAAYYCDAFLRSGTSVKRPKFLELLFSISGQTLL
jgi:hypothetical protein